MKQFLITVGAVLTAFFLFFIALPFILIVSVATASKPVTPSSITLLLDLREGLSDQSRPTPFDFITGRPLSTMDVVQALHNAASDARVKSVLIRLPEGGMMPAAAEEIRAAVHHVRKANKTVIAHSQGLYPDTLVVASYAVGASASELWMQPRSAFHVTGIATENLFYKRAFDKYGISPEMEQRYEYKNAVNPYLYSDFTPEHREATLSMLGGIYDSLTTAAAADRPDKKRDSAALKAVLEAGPYSAEQALELGLISKIGQVADAEREALSKGGANSSLLDVRDYNRMSSSGGSVSIAVINAEGPIMTGKGVPSAFGNEAQILSDDTSAAFYEAIENDNIKAIIFRVSSPGGSDMASEQVAQAVKAAKDAGKPVIVSMGDYAASGGYWISADASYIVANPSTLTGSIGVYGGKLAIGDALGRFGLDMRQIGVGGEYAGAYASGKEFTPAQKASISGWIDEVYEAFIQKVAKGRNMAPEKVREIAKGRVWTGAQAQKIGLVDKLGGFYTAVDEAKKLAKISDTTKVKLVNYPNQNSPFAGFGAAAEGATRGLKALSFLGWAVSDPQAQAVMRDVERARLQEEGANVLAPQPY
ncbi:MAG: signal peptide peptidase SppA [Asticcacaulis sp.]